MPTTQMEVGWLRELVPEPLGSGLVADAPVGATQLAVVDVVDFDEAGGTLQLGGELIGYAGTDPDADLILLNGPLTVAAEEDDFVAVWDLDNATPAADIVGLVELLNTNGDDDPVPATLTHALSTMLQLGPRPGRGERVWVEQYGNTWRIVDLLGKQAALDLSAADPDSLGGSKPLAPTGLVLSSSVYVEGGVTRGRIGAAWNPVVEDTDGAPVTVEDLSRYEVEVQEGTGMVAGSWQAAASTDPSTTTATMGPFRVATTYAVRVRAVRGGDTVETKSDWSVIETITIAADGTAPNKPSTPGASARLGVHTVTWDGKDYLGNPMPADFAYCELHRSTVNGFTPTPGDLTTLVYRFNGPGKFNTPGTYNVTDYFRLVAVDTSGNASTPSTQASSVAVPLVDTDLIGAVIAGANIKNGTIAAYDKIIGNTITGGLVQALAINTGHLQSNAVTADKADIGLLSALLVRGAQMETHSGVFRGVKINDDGIKAYDSSGSNPTPTFQVDSVTGAVTMKGSLTTGSSITGATLQTAPSGQRVVIDTSNTVKFYSASAFMGSIYGAAGLQIEGPSGEYVRLGTYRFGTVTIGGSGGLDVAQINAAGGSLTIGSDVESTGRITAFRLVTGISTTANAANTQMDTAGMLFKSTASAAKYKQHIAPIADLTPEMVLALEPKQWVYKPEHLDSDRVFYGFIADEAEALGLDNFVDYEDGEIENFAYQRFTAAQQLVLRDHEDRLRALEAKYAA